MIYRKGIPTHIDVNKLREAFGVPEPGTRITYSQIEDVTNLERGSFRYQTVVNAWRSKLDRENNVLFRALNGEYFEVLDSHGRIDVAGRKKKYGFRMLAKATNIASRTDRTDLTEDELKTQDHLTNVWARVQLLDQVRNQASSLDRRQFALEG